ncbi:MAG: flagellar basal body-associated FliL family protein [Opitutaceae bacterium]
MSDAPEEKPAEKNSASGKPAVGLLPMLIAIVLAPVLSWGVGKFLLVPQIETQVKAQFAASLEQAGKVEQGDPDSAAAAHSPKKGSSSGGGHGGKSAAPSRPKFEDLTVNIAGTQGTRYLKVSFNVEGKNAAANDKIDKRYQELVDASITILSSLTMPELDNPGSKAVVRGRLIAAFNDLLKAPLVEQVFFSDFVVQ